MATCDLPRACHEACSSALTPAVISGPNPALSRPLTWQIADAALEAITGARRRRRGPSGRGGRADPRLSALRRPTVAQVRAVCRLLPPLAALRPRESLVCTLPYKYRGFVHVLLRIAGDAVRCLGALSGAVWLLGVSTHAMCELCAPGAAVGSAVWRVKLVDVHVLRGLWSAKVPSKRCLYRLSCACMAAILSGHDVLTLLTGRTACFRASKRRS